MLRLAVLFLALAGPVMAECVPYKAMKKGVEISLEDGSRWIARQGAKDTVRIDQTNHDGAFAQYVEAPFGVYPIESTRNGIGTIAIYDYAKTPPQPFDGLNWASNAKQTYASQNGLGDVVSRVKVTATGSALRQVSISGCEYEAITLDLTVTSDRGTFSLRHLYLPALRFGIQTRFTDVSGKQSRTGITAMRAIP